MPKIKLGAAPTTIKHTAKFELLDGTKDAIKVEYVYRDRETFGKFLEEFIEDGKEADGEVVSQSRIQVLINDKNAKYMMAILAKWDLDDELTLENCHALSNQFPQATKAIMDGYSDAVQTGRLGN